MADRFFLIFRTDQGTATDRTVLEYFTEDEAHVPDLTLIGYDPATHGYVSVATVEVPEPPAATDAYEMRVDPSIPQVNYVTIAAYSIDYYQTEKRVLIAKTLEEWAWTQALDAPITKQNQIDFAAWLATVEAIPDTDPLWNTDPKSIVIPAPPAVVQATDNIGTQIQKAEYLDNNSVGYNKQQIADRLNMIPEMMFDEGEAKFYTFSNATYSFVADNRSGGKALQLSKTVQTSDAYVMSLGANLASIREGFVYTYEIDIKSTGTVNITGNDWRFEILWYNASKGFVSLTTVEQGSLNSTASNIYDSFRGRVTPPSGARYAGIRVVLAAQAAEGAQVTIDSVALSRTWTTEHFVAGSVNGTILAANSVNGTKILDGSVTPLKIAMQNLDTLQPVWGFDTTDGPAPYPFLALECTLNYSTTLNRSGSRCLEMVKTSTIQANVAGAPATHFRAAPLDVFYVDALVRSRNANAAATRIGIFTFDAAGQYIGSGFGLGPTVNVGSSWTMLRTQVSAPNLSNIRYASAVIIVDGGAVGDGLLIDMVNVSRVMAGEALRDSSVSTAALITASVRPSKVLMDNLSNLCPVMQFEEQTASHYYVSSGTLSFTTASHSGSAAAVITKTTAAGAGSQCAIRADTTNSMFSVSNGERIMIESALAGNAMDVASVSVGIDLLDVNRAYLTTILVRTGIAVTSGAWTVNRDVYTINNASAKYARLRAQIDDTQAANASISVDRLVAQRMTNTEQIALNAIHTFASMRADTLTAITTTGTAFATTNQLVGSILYLTKAASDVVKVSGSIELKSTAAGDVGRVRIWLVKVSPGGAETALFDLDANWSGIGGMSVPINYLDTSADNGDVNYRIRISKQASTGTIQFQYVQLVAEQIRR